MSFIGGRRRAKRSRRKRRKHNAGSTALSRALVPLGFMALSQNYSKKHTRRHKKRRGTRRGMRRSTARKAYMR